ncbi:PilZ domain-containing protein [Methylomonas sp. OY6]|uniref:PilZ domain-containing protein n=1 Tax=Methylomonas defluvii TaxID=3045149 RepID=A0ABU4UET9_9GAMM|nr:MULTISPECIES: PilZ domain-containing protein [unclassified Methylomonas]MDX8127691.1 PilZ domain-containing protein [Methylomonas sp. OY6]
MSDKFCRVGVSAYTLRIKIWSIAVENENRSRIRFNPEGLVAHIIIEPPPPGGEIIIDGQVVDMSYSGIKIRLKEPLGQAVDEAELRISIILPESRVAMSIHGNIKHIREDRECGLQYSPSKHSEDEFDDLMFECVKLAPQRKD